MNSQDAIRGRTRNTGKIDTKARPTTPTDLAASANGGTATANDYYGGNTPAMANDSNDSTYWNCNSTGLGAWLKIDLGAVKEVAAYRLYQYVGYGATSWKFQKSDDDSTYEDVLTDTTLGNTGKVYWAAGAIHSARYWKLVPLALQSNPYWDIYTWELWDA